MLVKVQQLLLAQSGSFESNVQQTLTHFPGQCLNSFIQDVQSGYRPLTPDTGSLTANNIRNHHCGLAAFVVV
jgi:hypothetical protein